MLDHDQWNGTYPTMWAAVGETLELLDVPAADRDAIYWMTAAALYGLE